MINRHPTDERLLAFARGALAGGEALLIAAHCDMCPHCAAKVQQFTETEAESAFAESDNIMESPAFSSMLASITQQPVAERILAKEQDEFIELDGRKFKLPRSLKRYSHSTGNWSKLVGKLWQAPVDIGGEGRANFIYMEKGGSVPEHTHKGNELTLVINGAFSDGINDYDSGDFIAMNDSHTHAPFSEDKDGCLVFTIVEEPLHFTSGIARLLNPFSHLFF
ncbi:anti-sigma factor [Alteromonas sediminis]|uniref:Anti-sigma factor n=1 Tax=Alteromonas sediminis TaxID=2259342 RepID=A0A3N5XXA9_9ALTE|nr:ChrR family anti-sigma-E factor [Alteromonas sediminis]RPJ65567.1 anti-sigma factor [Alteromonas sediminis]